MQPSASVSMRSGVSILGLHSSELCLAYETDWAFPLGHITVLQAQPLSRLDRVSLWAEVGELGGHAREVLRFSRAKAIRPGG